MITFQALGTASVDNERLAIVLGFITLTSGLLALLSCRICVSRFSRPETKNRIWTRGYALVNKYHIYYWWAFGVALAAHFLVAAVHTGLPQPGDPDTGIHWAILGSGLFSGMTAITIFGSCRVFPRLLKMATSKNPLASTRYVFFYKYHAHYWLLLGLLAIAHFWIGSNHAGIWPGK